MLLGCLKTLMPSITIGTKLHTSLVLSKMRSIRRSNGLRTSLRDSVLTRRRFSRGRAHLRNPGRETPHAYSCMIAITPIEIFNAPFPY